MMQETGSPWRKSQNRDIIRFERPMAEERPKPLVEQVRAAG